MRFMTLLLPGVSHHLDFGQLNFRSEEVINLTSKSNMVIFYDVSWGKTVFHLSDRTCLTEQHSILAVGLLHYIIHELQIVSLEML